MLKAKQKKATTKSITKEFDKLNDEEKSKIKRYITFKNKKLFTKKNQQRKLEFTREPVILFNEFLETDKIKKINESKIEEENLEKIYQEYKDLEQENLERIQKESKKKNLEYKSYIYDPQKLAHILFVYDHMQTKVENFTSDQLMKRIQCSILYHRREFINILETEDLEDECGLSENDSNKVINLKNIIKNFSNCSLKQKIIHHLTYFYLNDVDINHTEVVEIAKGDLEFIKESFKFLKAFRNVSIIEYRIIYEIVENISKILEIELVV